MTQQNVIKRDIKKLQQNKQFLAILILLFVALLFWITVSLISSQTTEKISPELQKLAKPLTPVIDTQIFERISAKKQYTTDELSSFTIYKFLVSSDGKNDRVVPLDVTAEDLEQEQTQNKDPNRSFLQGETQQDQEQSLPETEPTNQPLTNGSNLGEEL